MSLYDHNAYIHDALPSPLPKGTFVAEVEFEPVPEQGATREVLWGTGIRARVHRVLQGDYRGNDVIARPTLLTSCDTIFGNGRAGLIVAIPRGLQNGTLVIDPITAPSADGYRLPDGFQVDAERVAWGALPRVQRQQESGGWNSNRLLTGMAAGAVGLAAVWAIVVRRRRRTSQNPG